MLVKLITRALQRREMSSRRRREVLRLARLEDYLLADIGLSRHQVNGLLAGFSDEHP